MKSLSNDIEIGMSVVGKLYLHIIELDNYEVDAPKVAFDVSDIVKLEETESGTIVHYAETSGQFGSFVDVHKYVVKESKAEIEKAYADVQIYRNAALEKINSLLN